MTDPTAMPIARPLIRVNTCQRCKWAAALPAQPGKWQCRRFPPTATMFPNGRGGVVTAGDFPPVQPDQWCGEWQPRIEATN